MSETPRKRRNWGGPCPASKRIKNNPNATKGHKIAKYEGGLIITKKDGEQIRLDEQGNVI